MYTPLDIIILAAGKGMRMCSELPKVLHTLGGRSFLSHVVDSAQQLSPSKIHLVVGHGGDQIKQAFDNNPQLVFIEQQQQLGTGHAVQQALPHLQKNSISLILYGDVPLISATTLSALIQKVDNQAAHAQGKALALLTLQLADPSGYGRIVRDTNGAVKAIVEQKDADEQQQKIQEINTGIMAVS
ncbi:MAG: NTP transferase domain-containing protein, partial [Cellvibrionaceae bacterium]|nr:NTP transferase domain-containing protein [Cellvibrionaceae bacterium]